MTRQRRRPLRGVVCGAGIPPKRWWSPRLLWLLVPWRQPVKPQGVPVDVRAEMEMSGMPGFVVLR